MNNTEFKEYLEEKRKEGLDDVGCWQLRIAANMGLTKEKLDLLCQKGLTFANREWLYLALLDEVPTEWLLALDQTSANAVLNIRRRYFKQIYGPDESMEIKFASLQKAVTAQMEEYAECMSALEAVKKAQMRAEELEQEITVLKKEEEKLVRELQEAKENPLESEDDVQREGCGLHSGWKMRIGRLLFAKRMKKESEEFLELLKNNTLSAEQKRFLLSCREAGDSMDIIRSIAYERFSIETMKRIRRLIKNGS